MALTIRENILEAIKTVLETITTGNGYANTIVSIQRWNKNGNSLLSVPCIVINAGPEKKEPAPDPMTTCKLSVSLDLWIRQKETDTQSTDTILSSFLGDIEKALMADHTLSGNARDITIQNIFPFETVEGQPHSGLIIEMEVHYRHQRTDPTIAG